MTTKTNHSFDIHTGDILAANWGYDARYTDFYKVIKRTPKQVVLQQLKDIHSNQNGYEGWDTAPSDQTTGGEFRRGVKTFETWCEGDDGDYEYQDAECVYITDWARATKWNGQPVHNFDWH